MARSRGASSVRARGRRRRDVTERGTPTERAALGAALRAAADEWWTTDAWADETLDALLALRADCDTCGGRGSPLRTFRDWQDPQPCPDCRPLLTFDSEREALEAAVPDVGAELPRTAAPGGVRRPDVTRHDGKPDLPEPYKLLVWSFGAFAAVARGTTEAMKRLTDAWREEEEP